MATLQDFRDERLRKLDEIRALGVNPYPAASERTHSNQALTDEFEKLQGQKVIVLGRIMSIRKFGKLAFIVIRDMSGSVQLYIRSEDAAREADRGNSELIMPDEIHLLDTGDFVECLGDVVKTKTGEVSVACQKVRLISKALRPMPSSQEGFTDKEQRMRRRYVDMNVNTHVRERFERRSRFWQATRDFLNDRGFLEVNVPVLEHTTGGADANPFVTHMDALDNDFYLRISHELPLKRLIGAGFEKVYDLGPRFRNENYSDEHLPEHIAMEWYWAYADWKDGMQFMEEMYRYVLEQTFGTLQFELGDMTIDMSGEWEIWDYSDVIKKHYDINVFDCTIEEVQAALKKHKLEVEKSDSIPRGIDKLWKNIRKDVVGPVWLVNTPTFISPLSKKSDENPEYTQRFQPVIAGSELGNGWSELNDPQDQLSRFIEQQEMRDGGDDEAQMLDIDYVEMLEYGVPPTCGWGNSERVFWIFEGVTAREGVPFPQLKHEIDETTKAIYPEVYGTDGLLASSGGRQQDMSKRIVAVVNKELEPWQVANTASHMSAYHAHKMAKDEFDSGQFFVTKDAHQLPRNSQHPILIKRAALKDLRKLYKKAKDTGVKFHVFVKEMIETTSDAEIIDALSKQSMEEVEIYGIALYGDNDAVNALTKHFQLWK